MAKDVIITPASGLVQFKSAVGNTEATFQLDDNNNLNITAVSGDISIGDTTSDVYIGDGVNNVDIVFEQNGEIRALSGKTLTLGQSDSFITIASPTTVTGNVTASFFIGDGSNLTNVFKPTILTVKLRGGTFANVSLANGFLVVKNRTGNNINVIIS